MRRRAEHRRAVERRLRTARPRRRTVFEIQHFRLADRELETLAVVRAAGRSTARSDSRAAVRSSGSRVLPESLELDAPEHDAGRRRPWPSTAIASRAAVGGRVVLACVVEPAGLRQRRRPRGPAGADEQQHPGRPGATAAHRAMVTHERMRPKPKAFIELVDAFGAVMLYCRAMAEPTIVPRSSHTISRRDIDPGALKVLYRLHEHHYIAYLVGGSVRDLLLEPPAEGFRHRHVGASRTRSRSCFATAGSSAAASASRTSSSAPRRSRSPRSGARSMRRELTAEAEIAEALEAGAGPSRSTSRPAEPTDEERTYAEEATPEHRRAARARNDRLIQRDNTYGTPEEDAFRRDFTVNALFYDIGTFSIIDYVGGLSDLDAPVDPLHRRSRASASSRIRCACCARSSSRRGSSSRSTSRSSTRWRSIATRSRAARRRGCSRSTTRSCGPGTPRRRCGSCAPRS